MYLVITEFKGYPPALGKGGRFETEKILVVLEQQNRRQSCVLVITVSVNWASG